MCDRASSPGPGLSGIFVAAAALASAAALPSPTTPSQARHMFRDRLPDMSQEYLLSRVASSRPDGIDPKFDCAWREYAYSYAGEIQPWIAGDSVKSKQLYDALELGPLCQKKFSLIETALPSAARPQRGATDRRIRTALGTNLTVFVDPEKGNDSLPGAGSKESPFRTIASAVEAIRNARANQHGTSASILLRAGVYYMDETLTLTAQDSFLSISAYSGENAVLSGARHVSNVAWTKPSDGSNVYTVDLSEVDLPHGVKALQWGNSNEPSRATLARYPNADPERDLFPTGYITAKTDWVAPQYHGVTCDPKTQCGYSTTIVNSVPESEWHGMYQDWTTGVGGSCDVYDPPQSPWCSSKFYLERQFPEMHTRHPAGVFADDKLPHAPYKAPAGAIVNAWRPGHWYSWMFEINSHTSPTNGSVSTWSIEDGQNNVYAKVTEPKQSNDQVTYLGDFDTLDGCWSACNATKGCKDFTWHHVDFPQPSYAKGCYFTLNGEWSPTAQPLVTSGRGPHSSSGFFTFGAGGNQGGEGNEGAGEWFIEGVQEELDNENEFYYDAAARKLYLIPNSTNPPTDLYIPTLANVIEIIGSQAQPASNISITGVTMVSNRPTYMEPRSNPSGGDWALERMGAIFLEGTEGVEISENTFTKLDSNAIFLSGYNQYASLVKNNFRWLGQSAIASWGRPVENDGTNGEFPRYTLVEGNWVHEIGHRQKQSSFYFQAETAQAILSNNIVFNIPRAAINFNDGFGGGAELSQNLLFNSCRESSDHGAFNSWDRLPYLTTVRNGTASTIPAFNEVKQNFIVANYAADGGCLDNDDGSSYYDIHHNFCVYGGHKSDFDGNMKYSRFNIHAYASVYGNKCLGILAQNLPPKGYNEQYSNNICILGSAGNPYLDVGGLVGAKCLDGTPQSKQIFEDGLAVSNNTIYVPSGVATVSCGGKTLDLKSFQSQGYDPLTRTSSNMPDASTIISWAKDLLAPQH